MKWGRFGHIFTLDSAVLIYYYYYSMATLMENLLFYANDGLGIVWIVAPPLPSPDLGKKKEQKGD